MADYAEAPTGRQLVLVRDAGRRAAVAPVFNLFGNGDRHEIPGQRMEADETAIGEFRGAGGKLDEVAVYDRALSDDEIRILSEQTTVASAPVQEDDE